MKWITGILILTVIILTFLLWKSSGDSGELASDIAVKAKVNDSLKSVIVYHDSADVVRDHAVHLHDSIQSRKLDSALHLLAVNKDSLKSVKRTLQLAVADLGQSVAGFKDSSIQAKYDSVKKTLEQIYALGGAYINTSDTTIKTLMDMNAYKDSLNGVLLVEIKDLKSALTACTLNFDGLKSDTDKLAAKEKRQSLIAKIGTTLGTVVGFFIGHTLK